MSHQPTSQCWAQYRPWYRPQYRPHALPHYFPHARLLLTALQVATCMGVAQAQAQTGAEAPTAELAVENPEPFFKRAREGWFWYIDPPAPIAPVKEAKEPKPLPPPAAAPLTPQERDLLAFKAFQVKF
jgi:hypothetical protein